MKRLKVLVGMLAVSLFAVIGLIAPSTAKADEPPALTPDLYYIGGGTFVDNAQQDYEITLDRVGYLYIGYSGGESYDSPNSDGSAEIAICEANGNEIDKIKLNKYEHISSASFLMPAGHYILRYTQTGSNGYKRYISLSAANNDSGYNGSNYQVPTPNNRTIEKAALITLDKQLVQGFKWYYAMSFENRYYDKHYYKFNIETPQAIKFIMWGPSGETQLSLLDGSGTPIQVIKSTYDPGEDNYDQPIMRTDTLNKGTYYLCVEAIERPQYDHNATNQGYSIDIQPAKEMHRMYNPNSGEHLFTDSANERDTLVSVGWNYEGVMWRAPLMSEKPVYRLYNPNNGDHHYTDSLNEYNSLASIGWKQEDIAFYSSTQSGIAIERLYNPFTQGAGAHTYTNDWNEVINLVNLGWQHEGPGWYRLNWESEWL